MDQIVLNHVTKQFTTKTLGTVTAVNDFNLTIKEGECFSFLGPSGCGKTTTLRMIAGFEDLSDGEIHLCGRPVSIKSKNLYVPPEERGLGMVFQSFNLVTRTSVIQNVLAACVPDMPFWRVLLGAFRKSDKIKALESLDKVGILDKAYMRADQLSGGQQQRVAIARALVTEPSLLLADEPTGNLDSKTSREIMDILHELHEQGNTVVLITHDNDIARQAKRSIHILDGRVTEVQL